MSENFTIVILLSGDLGAGKTTLVKNIVRKIDPSLQVTSPSFVGMNLYCNDNLSIYHYDLYQIAINQEEFFEQLDNDKNKIFFIEWPENLNKAFLELLLNKKLFIIQIKISVKEDESRETTFSILETKV